MATSLLLMKLTDLSVGHKNIEFLQVFMLAPMLNDAWESLSRL
jgi:hypothetical protein